jgi:hypothetical protein
MSDINRFVRFSIDFVIKQIYFQTCYVVLNIMRRLARYVTAAGHAVIFQPLLGLASSWPPFCLLLIPVRLIAIHDLYWCDFVSHALTNLRQEAIDGQFLSIGNTVLSIQEALLTFQQHAAQWICDGQSSVATVAFFYALQISIDS